MIVLLCVLGYFVVAGLTYSWTMDLLDKDIELGSDRNGNVGVSILIGALWFVFLPGYLGIVIYAAISMLFSGRWKGKKMSFKIEKERD